MNLTCMLHNKRCTNFCSFRTCNSPNHFLCPRCIRTMEKHADHSKSIIDISRFDSAEIAVENIFDSQIEVQQLAKTLDHLQSKNERLLDLFAKIASKFSQVKQQIEDMIQTIREESVSLLTKDSTDNENDQEKASKVILKIYQDIPQLSSVMDVVKDQFKSLYRPLSKQLKTLFKGDLLNAVVEDNQDNVKTIDKIEDVGNAIDLKIEQLLKQFKSSTKEVILNSPNTSDISQVSVKRKEISSSTNSSEIEINYSQLFDTSASKPQKILTIPNSELHTAQIKSKKDQQNEKQNKQLSQSQRSDNTSSQIEETKRNESKPTSEKQLIEKTTFACEKASTINLNDILIRCIHQTMQLILYSTADKPQILNTYSLSHLRVTNTQTLKDHLVSASLNKEATLIVTASKYLCSVNDLGLEDSFGGYDLENEKMKPIGKVQFQNRNEIVVIYEDNCVEVFSYRSTKCYRKTKEDLTSLQRSLSWLSHNEYQNDSESAIVYFYKEVKSSSNVLSAIQLIQESKSIVLLDGRTMMQLDVVSEKYTIHSIEMGAGFTILSDSWKVISCGSSDSLRVYSVSSTCRKIQLTQIIQTEHNSDIFATRLFNENQWIVTASEDCTWRVFNCKSGEEMFSNSTDFKAPITQVEIFSDKRSLIVIDSIGTLITYTISNNE